MCVSGVKTGMEIILQMHKPTPLVLIRDQLAYCVVVIILIEVVMIAVEPCFAWWYSV